MTSEKRIQANRRNAQRSTGPRTPEGKARSRCNGLKHGLTGAGIVLAGEDGPAVEERVDAWAAELRPDGQVEGWLVSRAAIASVRLDRCVRRESAVISRAVDKAAATWDERAESRQLELIREFSDEKPGAAPRMQRTVAGCDWLLRAWSLQAGEVRRAGFLDIPSLRFALRQIDVFKAPVETDQSDASKLWGAGLAAMPAMNLVTAEAYLGIKPAADAPVENRQAEARARLLPRDEGREALLACMAEEAARLAEHREALWATEEGPARAAALDRVRYDASPEAPRMMRYESMASCELHRCFNQLIKVRKSGVLDEPDEPEVFPPAQDEPNAAPAPGATSVLTRPSTRVGKPPVPPESPAQDEPNAGAETPSTAAQDEPNGAPEPPAKSEVAPATRPAFVSAAVALIVLALLTIAATAGALPRGPAPLDSTATATATAMDLRAARIAGPSKPPGGGGPGSRPREDGPDLARLAGWGRGRKWGGGSSKPAGACATL